jgi:hypothetical protein
LPDTAHHGGQRLEPSLTLPESKDWSLRLRCRRAKAGAFAYAAGGQRLEPSLTLPEGKGWSLRLRYRTAKAGAFAYAAGEQRLEPSLTLLPQPPDEILKLSLVVLYGRNRHIHQTFHHPQIRGLRKVRLAFHRIQGNQ